MEALYMTRDTIEDQNDYDFNIREEEDDDGDIFYYDSENNPHNFDGPAYRSADGLTEQWFMHGKRHRDNGPAIIYILIGDDHNSFVFEVDESYYLFGHRLTKEKYFEIKDDENKKLLWMLQQGK